MPHHAIALLTALGLSLPAFAGDLPGYLVNCGWGDLLDRVGEADMPDGSGVVLAQTEAPDGNGYYVPNANHEELSHPLYIRRSGGTGNPSSHATLVGRRFYGLTEGLARGVDYVYCFTATGWATANFLHTDTSAAPDTIPIIKVWNHSWVGSFGNTTYDLRCNRKLDFAIDRDDDVVCVGLNNGPEQMQLLGDAFNTIAVGRRDGDHSGGFWTTGDSVGRVRPDLVGPLYTVSESTGVVSGAAAMLVQTAQDAGMEEAAASSEVIKAALMAGCVHQNTSGTPWSNAPETAGPDRGLSTQALDLNCGAGHLNINRSHMVMTAGQSSDGNMALPTGWMMTEVPEGDVATVRFTTTSVADTLNVVAVWNRTVTAANQYGTWWVADIDLELRLVDGNTTVSLLGDDAMEWVEGNVASRSAVGNAEHLHISGLEPGTYELQVQSLDAGGSDNSTEVALAWWSDAEGDVSVPGDFNGDGVIDVSDLLMLLADWGPNPDSPADLDGNGMVNVDDLLAFLSIWIP